MLFCAISAIKPSFGSNTPIFHVIARSKDGSERELKGNELIGPTHSLITRLNQSGSREAQFLSEYVADFRHNPIATSSVLGRGRGKHVFYGDDVYKANQLRKDCFQNGCISKDELARDIQRKLIDPVEKKATFDNRAIGLVLYADVVSPKYNRLNGIQITTPSGQVLAELAPTIPPRKIKKAQAKAKQQELIPAIASKTEPQVEIKTKAATQESFYQPDLLGFKYPGQPKHYQSIDDFPIRRRWKHKKS